MTAGSAATGFATRRSAWARFARRPLGVVAMIWLLAVAVAAVFAPALAPYNPDAQDLNTVLAGPSGSHLLGTDPLGRDVLSQLIFGARPTLIGVLCALGAWLVTGLTLGLLSGYLGGVTDSVVNRVVDLLLSLPALVILLVVFSVFPNSLVAPMAILGFIGSGGLIRVIRSVTLTVREDLYVRAARVAGVSHPRIIVRHILPRIAGTVIVQAALFAGIALVIESGLAFLGFGVVLPKPSWGGLIQEAAQELIRSAWLLVPSGGIIGLTVVAFVLFGNALRDTLTEPWAPSQFGQLPPGRRGRRGRAGRGAAQLTSAPANRYSDDVVLAVEGLSVELDAARAARPVVSDVSFTIAKGETLAVVGESGCGKTMMALAILGLLPGGTRRSRGRVLLGGQDLAAASAAELAGVRGRRIGYVAQEPMVSLDPTYTVGDQIAEAVRRHAHLRRRDARQRAVELLETVNIPDPASTARRYPHQLSGGMLQRCVIALALSGDPELLIADEPTTALDVTIQAEILALLGRLQTERGMAVLLVTHDWGVVAAAGSRAVVMYAGELVEISGVATLLARPAHPYTRALVASHPAGTPRGQRLPVIPGSVPAPGAWPRGCRFAPRCKEAGEECRAGPVLFADAGQDHRARCLHIEPAAPPVTAARAVES